MSCFGFERLSRIELAGIALVISSFSSMACKGETWQVGRVEAALRDAGSDAAFEADAASGCPAAVTLSGVLSTSAALPPDNPHHGQWEGVLASVEAQKFPSDRVRLRLDDAGQGFLQFIATQPLAPVQSGEGGHLCLGVNAERCTAESGVVGGFSYSLERLRSRGSVLSLSIALDEPWTEWCALQPSVPVPGVNGCATRFAPEAAYSSFSFGESCSVIRQEVEVPIDCPRLSTLLRKPCQCNASECRVDPARRQDVSLRLVGQDEMHGSIWFEGAHAVPLILIRETSLTDP